MEKCLECDREFEQLPRHIGKFHYSYKLYVLKFKYNNVRPLCRCGCGQETNWKVSLRDYAKFVMGHSARVFKIPAEARKRAGAKNKILMKQYYIDNPELAKLKVKQLHAGITEESEQRRIKTLRATTSTPEYKARQSQSTRNLWAQENSTIRASQIKAQATWKKRYLAGEYDFSERDEKISQTVAQKYRNQEFQWCKGEYASIKSNKTFVYRSAWELEWMQHFDSSSDVVSWDYECVIIPYEKSNGKRGRYLPDFLVVYSDRTEMIEIKPDADGLRNSPLNQAKFLAAQEYCDKNNIVFKIMGKLLHASL